MARAVKPLPAALGFRVKSGWAMAVLLAGNSNKPQLMRCGPILLSDQKIPGSKQPFHAALELRGTEASAVTKRLQKVVRDAAKTSAKELLKQAEELSLEVRAACLVVGSMVDPATLHNDHIRAHGLEGQLFRTALEDALCGLGIRCSVLLEKNAYASAAPELRLSVGEIRRAMAELGESHEGSWRAEEKLAALGAWMALTTGTTK
ncbi:MAG TPA: hypothetical protein VGI46_06100 [Candidatus Acidoferrum sp.]